MPILKNVLDNNILHIELNRPEVRNAINLEMVEELIQIFEQVNTNDQVRVILVSGAGDHAFSSGGDLMEFHAITTTDAASKMMNRVAHLLHTISTSTKVTIAAIHGYALGGGAELSTAFDIRLASNDAKIGFIQSSLGITTSWGGGSRLISIIGKTKALPLLVKGKVLPVQDWCSLGFVDQIFPKSSFLTDCIQYAQQFTERSVQVIKAYKQLANIDAERLQESIKEEINHAVALWVSEEHLEIANRLFDKHKRS